MMSLAGYVAKRIERTVTGPMWHGPALAQALDHVNHEEATARPIPGAHSIWEIVLHVTAWADIARARLKGQATGDPPPDQDWPPVPATSLDDWRLALEQLNVSHRLLAADVRQLADEALQTMVPGLEYSVSVLLHGVVEHGTYHAGQIVLLDKARKGRP